LIATAVAMRQAGLDPTKHTLEQHVGQWWFYEQFDTHAECALAARRIGNGRCATFAPPAGPGSPLAAVPASIPVNRADLCWQIVIDKRSFKYTDRAAMLQAYAYLAEKGLRPSLVGDQAIPDPDALKKWPQALNASLALVSAEL
jgi:hypothetical protein